jgi:hypothetical protein
MARKPLGYVVLILILGAMLGTLLGELIGLVLPTGVVKEFFLRSGGLTLEPVTLNAVVFTVTVGFSLKLNVVGLIGLVLAIYLLRWY